MSRRAKNFGLASVFCLFLLFSFPFVAAILGAFAILFAILSKGYHDKMDKDASFGVKLGAASLIIGASIVAFSFAKLYFDESFRQQTMSVVDMYYGPEYEEQFGMSPSELIESIIGGSSNAQ